MKKLIESLRSLGIEIPTDKENEVKSELAKNYKNVAEVNKVTEKLESERDSWKERVETAETTLKNFEGIDPANVKQEIENWKQKAADAEKDYKEKLEARDFEDALKTEIETYKFTSEAAKKSVLADIRAAGLKIKDGKILGLGDLIAQMKEKDASAFVDEQQQNLQQNQARFTSSLNQIPAPGTKLNPTELMKLKNENPNLDIKQYM